MITGKAIRTLKGLRITTLLFAALTIFGVAAFNHAVRAEERSTQELAEAAQNP